MSNHHTKKDVLRHYQQKTDGRLRRIERRRIRRQFFEASRQLIKQEVEYWHLAQIGFLLFWLSAVGVLIIWLLKYRELSFLSLVG